MVKNIKERKIRTTFSIVADKLEDTRPLGVIMSEWAKAEKLQTGVRWSTLTDKEVRSAVSVERSNALGVPYAHTKRVVAKVTSLTTRTRRMATYTDGKLVKLSGPIRRVVSKPGRDK